MRYQTLTIQDKYALRDTFGLESRLKPPSGGRAGGTRGTSAAAPGIGRGRAGYGLGPGSGGQGILGTVLGVGVGGGRAGGTRTPHTFFTRRFGLITAALLLAPPED